MNNGISNFYKVLSKKITSLNKSNKTKNSKFCKSFMHTSYFQIHNCKNTNINNFYAIAYRHKSTKIEAKSPIYLSLFEHNKISNDLITTSLLFNGYFYFSSIYFGFIAFGVISNPSSILVTNIARITIKNIFILNSIWGGVNLGHIISKQDNDIDDPKQKTLFSRLIFATFIPGLASFYITQNLINSSILSLSTINYSFIGYFLLQCIHITTTYILTNKKLTTNELYKHQLLLGLFNVISILLLYFFLIKNKNVLAKKGDQYRIENLKVINDLIEEDDELLSKENDEMFINGYFDDIMDNKK